MATSHEVLTRTMEPDPQVGAGLALVPGTVGLIAARSVVDVCALGTAIVVASALRFRLGVLEVTAEGSLDVRAHLLAALLWVSRSCWSGLAPPLRRRARALAPGRRIRRDPAGSRSFSRPCSCSGDASLEVVRLVAAMS
jgi:hypothetical protein